MRLKKKYFRMISDLSNWSMEMCVCSTFASKGISESDFRSFLRAYARFLRNFPDNPRDLLTK